MWWNIFGFDRKIYDSRNLTFLVIVSWNVSVLRTRLNCIVTPIWKALKALLTRLDQKIACGNNTLWQDPVRYAERRYCQFRFCWCLVLEGYIITHGGHYWCETAVRSEISICSIQFQKNVEKTLKDVTF